MTFLPLWASFSLLLASIANATCINDITDVNLCETAEIRYETGEGSEVAKQAAELGNAVAIYEYLRNEADFALYYGSLSNAVNTLLGLRGNNVDLATTLIAMLRAIDIPARFTVGTVRLPKTMLANWLGVSHAELAISLLTLQGIQNIDDNDPETVTFEHVWVEALVNYGHYRGVGTNFEMPCTTVNEHCQWIALDPSMKQYAINDIYHNALAILRTVFDGMATSRL